MADSFARGGWIPAPRPTDGDSVPAFLSPCGYVVDPQHAEALGLTVDARRLRDALEAVPEVDRRRLRDGEWTVDPGGET